jgi:hypothetical protein
MARCLATAAAPPAREEQVSRRSNSRCTCCHSDKMPAVIMLSLLQSVVSLSLCQTTCLSTQTLRIVGQASEAETYLATKT